MDDDDIDLPINVPTDASDAPLSLKHMRAAVHAAEELRGEGRLQRAHDSVVSA